MYKNLLCLVLLFTTLLKANAQALDNAYFDGNNNFTYCYQSQFSVADVTRYFNVKNSSYFLNFSSTTSINVTNLNQQGTTTAASFFQIRFGFKTFEAPAQQFCLDVISQSCPLQPNQNFTIQRDFNLTDVPLYPLADVTAQYSAIDADSNHLVCLKLAPVGYQHPTWQKIFTYIPMGITAYAAILSIITSITRFHEEGQHDIFLFSSNDVMLPGVLRLKTPGFFDLMYYSQFVVTTGLLSLSYPRFFPLFVSDFSWSFLLFDSDWLKTVTDSLFPSSSSAIESIATVPHQSLYKRQSMNGTANQYNEESSAINIIDTGMLNFANATGININALFFTFLIYFLIIMAACLLLCLLTWLSIHIMGRIKDRLSLEIKSKKMKDFAIGVVIRVMNLFYLPLLILAFFQLMIRTYWYITFAAALLISVSLLMYGFISIKLLQIRPASFIFTELKLLLRFGSLYNLYTDDTFHFYLAVIVYQSIIAAVIGLFQTSGIAQLIIMILAEVALTIGTFWKWPHPDSQVNMLRLFLNFTKTVVLFLNISFSPQIQATTAAKQYMGYALLAIHCLVYFIFLLLLVKNTIIILTGLGDDELDESGNPPARMVLWRTRKRSKKHHSQSSASHLISSGTPSRSQSVSFYFDQNGQLQQQMDGLTTQETLDLLKNYYNPQVHKPDEIKRVSLPLVGSSAHSSPPINATQQDNNTSSLTSLPLTSINYFSTSPPNQASSSASAPPRRHSPYVAQINFNPEEDQEQDPPPVVRQSYRLDDDIIPASEPLMTTINRAIQPIPPPLPIHEAIPSKMESNISSIYSPPHQPSITSVEFRNEMKDD